MTSRFRVRLTPRGGADRVEGIVDGILRARVSAAPVDGAANEALCRLVAHELDVPRTAVRVTAGATARVKTVEVEGMGNDDIRTRWPGLD